jgi:DHA1 family multidrug resistance protein-like MFS transporter
MMTSPAVAFANLYTCLIYGLYYTFFECIPRVYIETYKFTHPQVGLSFLSISIGAMVGTFSLLPWTISWMKTAVQVNPHVRPERGLVPALYASVIMPASLLLFG